MGLGERQDLEQLVQGPESSREHDQRPGEMREPELAHEEVVKLERQLPGDVAVGTLLVRESDVEADGPSVGFGRTAVRGLHDTGAASRADQESGSPSIESLGPFSDEAGQLPSLGVVTPERTMGIDPCRSEEDDGVVDALAPEYVEGLDVFGQYA